MYVLCNSSLKFDLYFLTYPCQILTIFAILQVKSKQVRSDIRLGGDVFDLTVRAGYDRAFIMGLIIVLSQMMPSD